MLLNKVYWAWRFSFLARPWFAIKTFVFLQWNARKTAIMLDDVMRAFGQMNHPSSCKGVCKKCGEKFIVENPDIGSMLMTVETRSKLSERAHWHTLPVGWKWR